MKRSTIFILSLLALAQSLPAAEWEKWDGCRLATAKHYDGDSFHVAKAGKDRIFRLYAVDTAETNDDFPERVKEQQKYFRATKADVLAEGKKAEEFTRRLLQQPFTVETQWIDAKGNSRQQRYFGKITLSDGTDLAVRLVEAGLARSYGMREGLAGSYLAKLDRAEADAKRSRLGLWGGKSAAMPEDREEPEPAPAAEEDMTGAQSVFDQLQRESATGLE
jgi:endonuclease YncB( thermonuclease family)